MYKSRKNRRMIKGLIISGLICTQLAACGSAEPEESTMEATMEVSTEITSEAVDELADASSEENNEATSEDLTEDIAKEDSEKEKEAVTKESTDVETKQKVINGVTVEWKETEDYEFLIKADNMTYMINTDEYLLQNEERVLEFIEYSLCAKEDIEEYIKESGAVEYIGENPFVKDKFTVYKSVDIPKARTEGGKYIYINVYASEWAHEYAHTMVLNDTGYMVYTEGIAEYLGNIISEKNYLFSYFSKSVENYQVITSDDTKEEQAENMSLSELLLKQTGQEYIKKRPKPANLGEIDYPYLYLMMGKVSVQNVLDGTVVEEGENGYYTPFYTSYNIPEKYRNPGDELSYYQAGSFVAYLSETYGFDKVVKAYMNEETFEESYGKSYEEVKEDWIEWILEQ